MKNKFFFLNAISFLFLSACASQAPLDDYSHYLRNKNIPSPKLESFPHCFGYGCNTIETVSLNEDQWKEINTTFKPAAKSPQEERAQISKAIKQFEILVGNITGTSADKRGTFRLYQDSNPKYDKFQQDCVDESTNTTIYLSLLKQRGLLKFHRPTQPQSRQPFISKVAWWHQTATIKEIGTDKQYAVDSWFEDSGKPAYVVEIEPWFKGWKPDKSKTP